MRICNIIRTENAVNLVKSISKTHQKVLLTHETNAHPTIIT